ACAGAVLGRTASAIVTPPATARNSLLAFTCSRYVWVSRLGSAWSSGFGLWRICFDPRQTCSPATRGIRWLSRHAAAGGDRFLKAAATRIDNVSRESKRGEDIRLSRCVRPDKEHA